MPFAVISTSADRVVVTFKGKPENDADMRNYIAHMDSIYKRKKRFRIIYDTRGVNGITLKHILTQAKYMRKRDAYSKKYIICCGIIANKKTKILLDTLFTFKKPSISNLLVSNNTEEVKKYMGSF
jgi:hypothetical protein